MPMTDAPNFGTKFGRRKPCLRYIGPLLCTASVASVALTPPSWTRRPAPPPVGGGLRPAPLARSVFAPIPVGSGTLPASRRGGPMCPPVGGAREGPFPGRHIGRPLHTPRPRKTGRGRSPAPTRHTAQSTASAMRKGKIRAKGGLMAALGAFRKEFEWKTPGKESGGLDRKENRLTPWCSYRSSPGSARWGCPCRRSRRSGRRGSR